MSAPRSASTPAQARRPAPRSGRSVALVLWIAIGVIQGLGASAAAQSAVFEDRTKHVSLRPPVGWLLDEDSDRERLAFIGPKSSGTAATLSVRALRDGVDVTDPAAVAAVLARRLGIPADATFETWDIGDAAARFQGSFLVDWNQGRKALRTGVAIRRVGPDLVAVGVDAAAAHFPRIEPDVLACLAGVETQPLAPDFTDEALAVRIYAVPGGFLLDEARSQAGARARWEFLDADGRSNGTLMLHTEPAPEDLAPWADAQEATLSELGDVQAVTREPITVSGLPGVLFESTIGRAGQQQAVVRVCVARGTKGYVFSGFAEKGYYDDTLRPYYLDFLHSITLGETVDR